MTVKSIREIESMMQTGNSLRKVGQTAMNDTSSRSHSLFTIYIETAETVSLFFCPHLLLLKCLFSRLDLEQAAL